MSWGSFDSVHQTYKSNKGQKNTWKGSLLVWHYKANAAKIIQSFCWLYLLKDCTYLTKVKNNKREIPREEKSFHSLPRPKVWIVLGSWSFKHAQTQPQAYEN